MSISLGIAVADEENEDNMLMSVVIKKGSKLPCKKKKSFTTSEDFQKRIFFQVYEGENKNVEDNYLLGAFELNNLPKKKKNKVNIEVTFELDEDSILTITAIDKGNKSNHNSIIIKNDKGGLSKNEIEEAKKKHENETIGGDLEPAMALERNYKKEIKELFNKINTLTDQREQYFTLSKLEKCLEEFIETFNKDNEDNFTYKQKMHYFLTYLFNAYSAILNFKLFTSNEEKLDIIFKVLNYLEIFEKNGINYAVSLVRIFKDNENEIFGEFCIQLLSFYSQKGTELFYSNEEKKNCKHILEEALSIIEKFSIKNRIENNNNLLSRFNSILSNCNELLNILKAESIEKYCKSFSKDILIKEEVYQTEEEKLDILDRFKDALLYLKHPNKREDKLLKAIYLANIVKIEYKMFNSNNYDTLLKMIEDCIKLKVSAPEGCGRNLLWFTEICRIKIEIEQKKLNEKENPKENENQIKEKIINIINEIDNKFKMSKFTFFFYILSEHPPNGIDKDFSFSSPRELENAYNLNKKKFMKRLRKLYNPVRYKGNKEEEQKVHLIMQEISMKLNSLD